MSLLIKNKTKIKKSIKDQFPILNNINKVNKLVYLDSAASSQKPQSVIDSISDTYKSSYANVHRGTYKLSQIATDLYEGAREKVASFINADDNEIIFTRGATEGLNLIAYSYGQAKMKVGEEVIITTLEHHSNIIPWQIACNKTGAKIVEAKPDSQGNISVDSIVSLFNEKTKIISIPHVVNSIGTLIPIQDICREARKRNIITVIDGCQAAPNIPIDVKDIDCDFYVFSGHKLYGPSGIGILFGKNEIINEMDPYQTGGEMIDYVSIQKSTFSKAPNKFEAGTPNIVGAIGLGAAIDFINETGIDEFNKHNLSLTEYGLDALQQVDGIKIIGNPEKRIGIISFLLDNIHPQDLSLMLDSKGFSLRSGHHCAQPTMRHFNVETTIRASIGIYNEKKDFDELANALRSVKRYFN